MRIRGFCYGIFAMYRHAGEHITDDIKSIIQFSFYAVKGSTKKARKMRFCLKIKYSCECITDSLLMGEYEMSSKEFLHVNIS